MTQRATISCFLGALVFFACGSDAAPKAEAGDGGRAGASGAAANGGKGGSAAGASGTSAGRRSPTACDQSSRAPVQCGGETCPTTAKFETDPCFIPCCVTANGSERCGFRGTSAAFTTECVLPAVDDETCDAVPQFQGCCEQTQHVCGIIGGFAPGCQTKSSFVTLPKSPKPCGRGDTDAGAP